MTVAVPKRLSGAVCVAFSPAGAAAWANVAGDAGLLSAGDRVAHALDAAQLVIVEDALFDPPRLEAVAPGPPGRVVIDLVQALATLGVAHRMPDLLHAAGGFGADPLDRARGMSDLLVRAGGL